jgi:hypothetical protein
MAAPLITFQTYPQEWRDHYTEAAYALRDPILAGGLVRSAQPVGATLEFLIRLAS